MRIGPIKRLVIIGFGLLILCSCAPTDTEILDRKKAQFWQSHVTKAKFATRYEVSGRTRIKTPDNGITLSFIWKQLPGEQQLRLIAPLGQGVAKITRTPTYTGITTAEGEYFEARTAETLMQRHLGYAVSLDGLGYWLLGVPHPVDKITASEFNDYGLLKTLSQSGWQIEYLQYQQNEEGWLLPYKVDLTHGKLKARFLLKNWKFESSKQSKWPK